MLVKQDPTDIVSVPFADDISGIFFRRSAVQALCFPLFQLSFNFSAQVLLLFRGI